MRFRTRRFWSIGWAPLANGHPEITERNPVRDAGPPPRIRRQASPAISAGAASEPLRGRAPTVEDVARAYEREDGDQPARVRA